MHTAIDGTTLRGIIRGGEEVGLAMRPVKSSDRIDTLPLPAIVHWQGNHWIVLYRIDGDRLRVADPGRGLRTVSRAELEEKWSGYAALAAPTERLAQAPRGGLDLRWLWPFVAPHRRRLAVAVVLALLAAALEMTLPIFSQVIIDQVIRHNRETLLYVLAGAMVVVVAFAVGITIAERLVLARTASQLDVDTLDFLSARLLRLPMRYFEARRTGDIERRISGMRQVRAVLIQQGVAALTAVTQLIVALAIMFSYSWSLALAVLRVRAVVRRPDALLREAPAPGVRLRRGGLGRYQSRQIDAIRGIETVKAMGAEEGLRHRMLAQFGAAARQAVPRRRVAMVYEGSVRS